MADALIETMSSNPYDGIIADTATQISNIDAQIQQILSAITNLEQTSPTSPTLPKLKERLASLQSQKQWLTTTNESARSLSNSFNQSSENLNTLKWIYDIKQQELERAKAQDDMAYRRMYDDTQKQTNNYTNALWNATASENAIINANAWRQWASAQSTAEARARNYLANAQAQNESANTARQQLNAIEEWRINSWQWYVQLSQWNADNYLRQQVLNDYQSAEAEKDRQFQREMSWRSSWWWGGTSRWTSNIIDPYDLWWWNNGWGWWGWDWESNWITLPEFQRHNIDLRKGVNNNTYEYQSALLDEEINALKEQASSWAISLDDYSTRIKTLNDRKRDLDDRWKYEKQASDARNATQRMKDEYINNQASTSWIKKSPDRLKNEYEYQSWSAANLQKKADEARLRYFNSKQ